MKLLLVLVMLLAGCAGGAERPRALVTDSAGVRIVSNGRLPDAVVRIDGEPVTRVGWTPGGLEFADITSGAFLGDGSVVVFDGGAQTLHILSLTGVPLARAGRSGEGPGEFQGGEAVEVAAGDTLVVFDEAASRISLFDRDGTFLESALWERPPRYGVRPSAVTASGRLVWVPFAFVPYRTDEPGTRWVNGPLFVSSRLGADVDTLARVPLFEFPFPAGGGVPTMDPFTRGGSTDGHAGGFVWGRNDTPELRWADESGALRQIARWEAEPVPVDDAIWARYGDAYRAMVSSYPRPPSDQRIAQVLAERREIASSTLPFFSHVHAGPDGRVWVSEWTPLQAPARLFEVFEADGTYAHRLEFTRPIQILALGRGRVLGIERDELDVQAVVVYAVP